MMRAPFFIGSSNWACGHIIHNRTYITLKEKNGKLGILIRVQSNQGSLNRRPLPLEVWVDVSVYVMQISSDQISQDLWARVFQHLEAKTLLQTVSLVNHEWLSTVRQLTSKFVSFTRQHSIVDYYYCPSRCVRPFPPMHCSPRP